jgi:tetratricopeptide (TPR) repeat protein
MTIPALPRIDLSVDVDAHLLDPAERRAVEAPLEAEDGHVTWMVAVGRLLRAPIAIVLRRRVHEALGGLPAAEVWEPVRASVERWWKRVQGAVTDEPFPAGAVWEVVRLRDDLASVASTLGGYVTHAAVKDQAEVLWDALGSARAWLACRIDDVDELMGCYEIELASAQSPPDARLLERLISVAADETPWGRIAFAVAEGLAHGAALRSPALADWLGHEGRVAAPERPALRVSEPGPWALPSLQEWLATMAAGVAGLAPALVSAPGAPGTLTVAFAAADRSGGSRGEIWIPVLTADGAARTVCARVRVAAPGEVPPLVDTAPGLLGAARVSVRRAFHAAAGLMPGGRPPAPFEGHAFEIALADADVDAIDGESLGLPIALAFLAAWSQRPLGEGVVASGLLLPSGEVRDVGGFEAKVGAAALGGRRFVVPAAQAELARITVPALEVFGVTTLADAVRCLGLTLPAPGEYRPWLGDTTRCLQELERLARQVESQDLGEYADLVVGAGGATAPSVWTILAGRMQVLIDGLAASTTLSAPARSTLQRARAHCALAYLHAADLGAAQRLLRDLERAELPPALAVWADCVTLSARIDEQEPTGARDAAIEALAQALRDVLPGVPSSERALLQGQAEGSIGRCLLHERRLEEALPWLERSVATHDAGLPHESARSRVYLSMCQRERGDGQGALETLLRAKMALEEHTRPFSAAYAATTAIYVEYELARVLLALGRAEDARTTAVHAAARARRGGLPWPLIGILRVQAWAEAALGRVDETTLTEIDRIAAATSNATFARVAAESRRPVAEAVEIY